MGTRASSDVLVLGAGPGALAIAAALGRENLKVEVLSVNSHNETWPYTYGIWGDEVDEFGLEHLLEHRWANTVSFFGQGSIEPKANENKPTNHQRDYGLFDKRKLQLYWIRQCDEANIKWHRGHATELDINDSICTVTTSKGLKLNSRFLIDATGSMSSMIG